MSLLEDMPSDWQLTRLEDHLEVIRNGITKTQNKDGKGWPVTRIETIAEDRINLGKLGYIKDVTERDLAKYALRENDILFSHINSEPQIGRSVVCENLTGILLHGMNLLMLRTKPTVDSHFLNCSDSR
jgi:type I restriction enzyme S subunit